MFVSKNKVRQEIIQLIGAVLGDPLRWTEWGEYDFVEVKSHLLGAMEEAVKEKTQQKVEKVLDKIINNEKFIDDIVKRIKDKQL